MPRPLSFPREKRLVLGRDFQRAYREGGRAKGRIVLVIAWENGTALSRLGVSVGRSVWKSAVKRNRVRRIFREAFRLSYPDLPRGVDVVLIPAEPKLVPTLSEVRAELATLIPKALARRSERRKRSASDVGGRT